MKSEIAHYYRMQQAKIVCAYKDLGNYLGMKVDRGTHYFKTE